MTLADVVSLTVTDAARVTGLSEREIRDAYRSGELVVRYRGTRVVIRRDDLEQWINGLPTERASA